MAFEIRTVDNRQKEVALQQKVNSNPLYEGAQFTLTGETVVDQMTVGNRTLFLQGLQLKRTDGFVCSIYLRTLVPSRPKLDVNNNPIVPEGSFNVAVRNIVEELNGKTVGEVLDKIIKDFSKKTLTVHVRDYTTVFERNDGSRQRVSQQIRDIDVD